MNSEQNFCCSEHSHSPISQSELGSSSFPTCQSLPEPSYSLIPLFSKKISKKSYNKSRLLASKANINASYCKFKILSDPMRILNPFATHRMEGDLFLYEKSSISPDNVKGLIANFNCCKQPMSSIHDKTLQVVHFKVESHDTVFTPIDLMVHRLDSLNDIYAHELAETVKYYGLSLDFIKKMSFADDIPSKNHIAYRDYLAKIKKVYEKYMDIGLIVSDRAKFNIEKKRFEVVEISFNELFIQMTGVSIEKFIRKTMKKGFPDLVHIPGNYHEWCSKLLQMTGVKGSQFQTKQLNCVFWAVNETVPLDCQVIIESISLNMENYIENTTLVVCVPKTQDLNMLMKERGEGGDMKKKMDFEISFKNEDFIKKLYPLAIKDDKDDEEI